MYALVAGGILLIIAEKFRPAMTAETLDDIGYKQTFGIGLRSCLALWAWFLPLRCHHQRRYADGAPAATRRRVSFIMAVPMMIAASGLDLYQEPR